MDLNYPYIQVWGNKMGSYQYYIDAELQHAYESRAPRTAIFRRFSDTGAGWDGKTWATAESISSPETRYNFALACERAGVPIPQWNGLSDLPKEQ